MKKPEFLDIRVCFDIGGFQVESMAQRDIAALHFGVVEWLLNVGCVDVKAGDEWYTADCGVPWRDRVKRRCFDARLPVEECAEIRTNSIDISKADAIN